MNQQKLLESPKDNEERLNKMTKKIKPMIDEANEIAESLAQEVRFDLRLARNTLNLEALDPASDEKYKLEIRVSNNMHNEMYYWDV